VNGGKTSEALTVTAVFLGAVALVVLAADAALAFLALGVGFYTT
jgi:hypothetical protein